MNNTECQQSTIMELMIEIDRLRQENVELRNDNQVLHNKLLIGNYDKTLFEKDSSEVDNDYSEEVLESAYWEADKNYKIGNISIN